jgi:ribose 5-phosphate isomerase A
VRNTIAFKGQNTWPPVDEADCLMPEKVPGNDAERLRAAEAAIGEVRPGMKLGLGRGRTAEHFVRLLGVRVRAGLKVVGVPTSERTARLAGEEGVPITTLDADPVLDLTIDGADEIDPALRLIKGAGGALLREKIVAAASRRMVVIADAAKKVETLGRSPLPVEVIPFGAHPVRLALEKLLDRLGLSGQIVRRTAAGGAPFATDSGNHIFDLSLGRIPDPDRLAHEIDAVPGVVEHGLFIGMASAAIFGRGNDVTWLHV